MGGGEALAAIREIGPTVPVVLMSGYAEVDVVAMGTDPRTVFLSKPFTAAAMAMKVAEASRLSLEDEAPRP